MSDKIVIASDSKELLLLAGVFLLFFIIAYAAISWHSSQTSQLYGFSITAGGQQPLPAIKQVLEKNRSLILREEVTTNASKENSAVAAASAELVYAAYSTGIIIHNYGAVGGSVMRQTCNANNSNCGAPDITIAFDPSQTPCNCIKVFANRTMLVTGGANFLLNHATDLRKIILAARAYNESRS